MKATMVKGRKVKLKFRSNSKVNKHPTYDGKVYPNLSCDIYNIEGDERYVVLVLITGEFKDIPKSLTIMPMEEYQELVSKYGTPQDKDKMNTALLRACGAQTE